MMRERSKEWRPGFERGAAYCLVTVFPLVFKTSSMSMKMPCSFIAISRCF